MSVMTINKLENTVDEGRGQGHGLKYLPWLFIRRRNPSPVSNQVAGAILPGLNRECCFLARTEWLIALMSYWLGALDVREQFPLWPWPHPHPLYGVPCCDWRNLPASPGLIEIAKEAGIDHGVFVGSKVPYVATTDLAVTVRVDPQPRLAAIAVKAEKPLLDSEPTDSVRSRLELERRYHAGLANPFTIATEELVSHTVAGNLVWMSSGASIHEEVATPLQIAQFAELFERFAPAESIERGVSIASQKLGLAEQATSQVFRHCAWARLIDLDLTLPIVMAYPPHRGTDRIVAALRQQLFGDLS